MASQEGKRGVLSGIERDLAGAIAEELTPDEQLEIFALPTKYAAGARADAARAAEQRGIVEADERARGVGRPKGSRNKTTRDMVEYARKLGLDPMVFFLRWARHTPQSLSTELGITAAEAFDKLVTINKEIRKVFIADAVPVDDEGKPLPQFNLQIGGNTIVQVTAVAGQPTPPWLTDKEIAANVAKSQQKQALTLDHEPQSHEPKSHEEVK